MKTSQFTAVGDLIHRIAGINTAINELSKCSAINAVANNYETGQIRLSASTQTATGKHVVISWIDILTDEKQGYILKLKEYNVEYDGE